ncbi:hypothetical protein CMV_027209 [Castanea mollissima]|uniref:Vps53 N-terminal domain-containing protein n=1 Tax=Castanea mollissima TaxID=60419 RepID=A0A8J4QAG1_9ROSI|nr:hypothetical protein CMV_027209 [Castanea mollissima]
MLEVVNEIYPKQKQKQKRNTYWFPFSALLSLSVPTTTLTSSLCPLVAGGKLLHGIFQFLLPAKMDKSSTLEYINQMFPTEASLSGVEPLMQKIKSEINHVDSGILAAVRQQSNSGTKAKEDLAAATRAVEELMYKI